MSSNPLNIEDLFKQLNADIESRLGAQEGDVRSGSFAHVELRIDSHARLIAAHPENTHGNTRIPSTEVLMRKIESCIETYRKSTGPYTPRKEGHALVVKAFTRIIAGRK